MKFKIKYNEAFTLIELLAAVAIVGVIATLALPRYRSMVARSRQAEATTNLGMIAKAQKIYATESEFDYGGTRPLYHSGMHYGIDKCGDSASEGKNSLGFRLSDCTSSRYRYITNSGNDCAKSDGSTPQGQVYPGCAANDEWHITQTSDLSNPIDVIKQCPDATGSTPSSSCVAVALPTITTPTPALTTAPTPTPSTSPSPTLSVSPTPTVSVSPSPSPTVSVSPSPTITPTPTCKASCAAGCTSWTHDRYTSWSFTGGICTNGNRQEQRTKYEKRTCNNLCSGVSCLPSRNVGKTRCTTPSPTPTPTSSASVSTGSCSCSYPKGDSRRCICCTCDDVYSYTYSPWSWRAPRWHDDTSCWAMGSNFARTKKQSKRKLGTRSVNSTTVKSQCAHMTSSISPCPFTSTVKHIASRDVGCGRTSCKWVYTNPDPTAKHCSGQRCKKTMCN